MTKCKYAWKSEREYKCPTQATLKSLKYRSRKDYPDYFKRSEESEIVKRMLDDVGLKPHESVGLSEWVVHAELCSGDYENCPTFKHLEGK